MNAEGIKKKLHKALLVIAINVVALLFLQGTPVQAESIKIIVHGNELQPDVPPVIIDERVMVPLKAIFDAVQADTVIWDDETKTVVATKGGNVIVLRINDKMAIVNDGLIELDVAPQIINGRTMVPARFIAESLNLDVYWLRDEKTVVVTEKIANQWEYYATDHFRISFSIEDSNQYKIETDSTTLTVEFDENNGVRIDFLGKYPIELFDFFVSSVLENLKNDNGMEFIDLKSQEIEGRPAYWFTFTRDGGIHGEYIIFYDWSGNLLQTVYVSNEQSEGAYKEKFQKILERMVIFYTSEPIEEVAYEKVDTPMFSFSKRSDWEYTAKDVNKLIYHTLEVSPVQVIQLSILPNGLLTKDTIPIFTIQKYGDVNNLKRTEYLYRGFAAEEYTYERSVDYERYDGTSAVVTIKGEVMLIHIDDDSDLVIALESPEQLYDETYEAYMELLDSLVIKGNIL